MRRLCILCLFAVFLPAYTGIIYRYRSRGWKGLFLSLGWLFLGCYLGNCATSRLFYCLMAFAACFLLLSCSIAKDWFSIPKKKGLAVIWGGLLGCILCFCTVILQGDGYRSARIKTMLHKFILWPQKTLFAEEDYVSLNIRLNLDNIPFVGKNTTLPELPKEGSLSFFLLMNEYGSLAGILMTGILLLLFIFMFLGIRKQKNVLGSLLGIACLLGMLLPSLIHIFSNLSMLVYTDMFLPFFYPGYMVNVACYGLTGLYLSIYRYKDVVA